jgi:hypothetical protein
VILATALVALGLALPATSNAAVLDYACEPPSPPSAANCAVWHTTPVTVHWLLDGLPVTDCPDQVISTDTAGTNVTCSLLGGLTNTATVRVDQTPPAVTGAVPDRPPDHDGWYNHPVGFSFAGTDATSGIASCDSVAYSGPDTATGQVSGACRDVAGNTGTGGAPLMYDATAPTITPLPQNSGPGQVDLAWTGSPDTVLYTVTREPGRDGPSPSTVYTGIAPSYTDYNVVQSQSYTYNIAAADAAANSSSVVIVAQPGGSQMVLGTRQTAPKRTTRKMPRLKWRRVRHADYYNVQLYRGRRKILSAWPRGTHLQLHAKWRFRGRTYRLRPGRYHWYAWPGFGNRRRHQYGRMICHKRFTMPKPNATRIG